MQKKKAHAPSLLFPLAGILFYLILSAAAPYVPAGNLPELHRAVVLLLFSLIYAKAAAGVGVRLLPHPRSPLFAIISAILPLFGLLQLAKGIAPMPLPKAAAAILLCAGVAATEELLFRGTLTPALKKRLPAFAALLISDSLFALLHGLNLLTGHTPAAVFLQIAAAFLCGLLLEMLHAAAGGLLPCILFHFLFNVSGRFSADSLPANLLLLSLYAVLTLLLALLLHHKKRR